MPRTSLPRVAVVSDQALVAEAIGVALAGRNFDVVVRPWAGPAAPAGPSQGRTRGPRHPNPDVGLLLSDLDRPARVRDALRLLDEPTAPWVVLTAAPRGPIWGAVLERGARVVAPSSTTLDELTDLLKTVAAGNTWTDSADRQALVDAWHTLQAERADLEARVASMSPQESEVLGLLYAGTPVRTIADRLELSEATVRSQVKRILRKLDVKSQLEAIAAVAAAEEPGSLVTRTPERSSGPGGEGRDL
jgi:RNA polymerase sigma factor (sigma-70 family)